MVRISYGRTPAAAPWSRHPIPPSPRPPGPAGGVLAGPLVGAGHRADTVSTRPSRAPSRLQHVGTGAPGDAGLGQAQLAEVWSRRGSRPRAGTRARALATTTSPMAARPSKPPAMPIEMTVSYGSSASALAVAAAEAAMPMPPARTVTSPALVSATDAAYRPRVVASAVSSRTDGLCLGLDGRDDQDAAHQAPVPCRAGVVGCSSSGTSMALASRPPARRAGGDGRAAPGRRSAPARSRRGRSRTCRRAGARCRRRRPPPSRAG